MTGLRANGLFGMNKMNDLDSLRAEAEARIRQTQTFNETQIHSAEDALHELQLYQTELEMQNDNMRQLMVDLEKSRAATRIFMTSPRLAISLLTTTA